MRKTLSFWFGFLSITAALGQNMHVSWYSTANGLPSNEVRHLALDTLGYAWIATDAGLVRFDGQRFDRYSQYIPSQYGKHLTTTEEGLFLSHDAGISLIQPALDTTIISLVHKASIDPRDSVLYYPDQMFMRKNEDILVGQPAGQVHYISSDGITQLLLPSENPRKRLTKIYFGEVGDQLWIARSDGALFSYNPQTRKLEQKASFPVIRDMKSKGNSFWIAADVAYHLQMSSDGKQIVGQEAFPATPGEVTALALDQQENVYLGIQGQGLYYLDRTQVKSPDFIKVYGNNDPHTLEELPFRNINSVVVDPEGKLWICSSEGLGILQKRFFESIGTIPNANATAISIADNGNVFVNFGDLYRIESTNFGYSGQQLSTASLGTITALATKGNRLWTGTSTGILYELDQDGRRMRTIDLEKRGEGIFYLSGDSKNRIWVAQAPRDQPLVGIGCLLPDGSFREYGREQGLENRIICLRETSRGRIYASGIGKDTYFFRYDPEKDGFVNLSLPFDFYVNPNFQVHDFAVDKKGIIWLASTDGLLRHDMDRISKVELGPRYNEKEVRAVKALSDGSIWISFDTEGVLRYTEANTILMQEESGLPSKIMTYRCLQADNEGRLWIGTAEGIVYSLGTKPEPGKSRAPWLISTAVEGVQHSGIGLDLGPDETLSITYSAPSFHGFRTFYQHRINDAPWSVPTTARTMDFSGLAPGNYSLNIRAKKEGAYLWSEAQTIDFSVSEYWYKSRGFLWALGLVITALLSYVFWSQKRRFSHILNVMSKGLKAKEEVVEKQEADLIKVREEVRLKQRERKATLLVLEIMHRLISKIGPHTKWDLILENISTDLLKLPGVEAFEIGVRRGKNIEFEGYSDRVRGFTSAKVAFDPATSLAAYCITQAKPFIFNRLQEEGQPLLKKKDTHITAYKSAISVPFYIKNREAVLTVYAGKEDLFDEYNRKAFQIFASYLEQIL